MRRPAAILLITICLTACHKNSPAAPSDAPPVSGGTGGTPAATACAAWAAQQLGSGVPPAPGATATQRQTFYAAGGGIRAVGSKYYGAWFPSSYDASTRKRVLVALHGTGGSPEGEWVIDWASSMQSRGWGFLGLKYLDDASGSYDDEVAIYAQIKAMVDDVKASCAFGSPQIFLVGFSRGSAQAYPLAYLDLKDRHLFTAIGNNSGAWIIGQPMTPTLQGVDARGETTAFSGSRFWMYCGERDMEHGYPICDEMQIARTFVETRGASILGFYRDPTGAHGGLNKNADALSQMFTAFESF